MYSRPLQNPREKLLYHRSTGGSGQRNLLNTAGTIRMSRMRFVLMNDSIAGKNPTESLPVADSIRSESAWLLSEERLML